MNMQKIIKINFDDFVLAKSLLKDIRAQITGDKYTKQLLFKHGKLANNGGMPKLNERAYSGVIEFTQVKSNI